MPIEVLLLHSVDRCIDVDQKTIYRKSCLPDKR